MVLAVSGRAGAAVGAFVLIACSAPSPSALAVPTRPPLPDEWMVLEGPQGDVQLAVPPDMMQIDIGHSLLVQTRIGAGAGRVALELTASPPRALPDQPEAGQTVEAWLEELVDRIAPPPDIAARGPTSTRQVALPAGQALELRTSFSADGPDDTVMLYAIRTSGGFGLLQVLGQETIVQSRSEEIGLITLLLDFGPAD